MNDDHPVDEGGEARKPLSIDSIVVDPKNLHPLVKLTLERIRMYQEKKIRYGKPHPPGFDVRVGASLTDRAIAMLEKVVRWAESCGYTFQSPNDRRPGEDVPAGMRDWITRRDRASYRIVSKGEWIEFRICEPNTVSIEVSPGGLKWPKKRPSGTLEISYDASWDDRKTWKDRKTVKVEAKLGVIADAIQAALERLVRARPAQEAEDAVREARMEKWHQQLKRQEKESAARKELSEDALEFENADRLRAYIEMASIKFRTTPLSPERRLAGEAWLKWARSKLEEIDPLQRDEMPWERGSYAKMNLPDEEA